MLPHYVAKMLLNNSQDMQIKSVKNMMDTGNGVAGNMISHTLVNVGQWAKTWTSTPLKREAIMQTLPVMHAFFTFFLVILTPLVLILSNYSPKAVGSICALFIMSLFLPYLWHLVGFVERSVLDPLESNDAISAMRNMAVMFYFAAPVLLLKLSSHFGGEAGASILGLIKDSDSQSSEASRSGLQTAQIGSRVAGRML